MTKLSLLDNNYVLTLFNIFRKTFILNALIVNEKLLCKAERACITTITPV